jgi:hypothetical protein
MCSQTGPQLVDEFGALDVQGGNIDADFQLHPLRTPCRQLIQRLMQYPLADRDVEIAVLDHRQERDWRQQTAFGMSPTDQGLGADHCAAAHVDLGLIVQLELLLLQRLPNALATFPMAARTPIAFHVVEGVASASSLFGGVHGLVRVAQQGIRILVVAGIEADADAGGRGHAGGRRFRRARRTA